MKIAIGSDHAGFEYKEKIKILLTGLGHDVRDFGTFSAQPVDYPLFIRPTAEAVAHDSNVLSLGQRMMAEELAIEIVNIWLVTPFAGGRHARRIALIE